VLLAGLEQLAPVLERTELHLVDGRCDARCRRHLAKFANAEVGDADRAGVAELASALHARPGPGRTGLGPVDDVQVDLVDAEPSQALLGFGGGVIACGTKLGRDEHLVARHAAVAQRASNALLVAVSLGGVDVAISDFERPTHGVDAPRSVGHLPDAEAEHRHLVSVREHASAPVCRHCAGCHGCLLGSMESESSRPRECERLGMGLSSAPACSQKAGVQL
jgi:hypothetical protein